MLDLKALTQELGDLEEELVMNRLNEFAAKNPSEADALRWLKHVRRE
jgi:hypothetical protein